MSESQDSTVWILSFVARICSGQFPYGLTGPQFDSVLRWLNLSQNEASRLIQQQFEFARVTPDEARKMALKALDAHLFAAGNSALQQLGFIEAPSNAEVKKRYRRLQQLFHPDKPMFQVHQLN